MLEIRGQNNQMTGTIPPEIENLHELRILRLESNQLTGQLPNTFQFVTNLGT
jgi:Leucine Rich Repeat